MTAARSVAAAAGDDACGGASAVGIPRAARRVPLQRVGSDHAHVARRASSADAIQAMVVGVVNIEALAVVARPHEALLQRHQNRQGQVGAAS